MTQKELTKRMETATNTPKDIMDTLLPLIYRTIIALYNKSHVPAIMEYARTDETGLASTAHEVLRELSSRTPEVLKAHVQEICKMLQDEAPTAKKPNDPGAVDNLKACASFAQKFASDIPQDRKFIQALTSFALYGSPAEAAKHAVSIMITASDKKELLAKDLVDKCVKGFQYGNAGFLSRLATISQLMLLTPHEVEEESDAIIDIAIKDILLKVRAPSTTEFSDDAYAWSDTIDSECEAKCWALKILVNRIRSYESAETLGEIAAPVYNLLATLVSKNGEVSSTKNTPPAHKSRLRLLAARLYLKLCVKKSHDAHLTPTAFNALALVAQDSEAAVRTSFLQRLKKYLSKNRLPQRFYAIPFLLAFEPTQALKSDTTTWIRSRAAYFSSLPPHHHASSNSSTAKPPIVLESVFARLLSLLAHHPDYAATAADLTDFTRYILFYLQNVATEDNLSLIYHIAQRIKQHRDAIALSLDENLYTLSDLAQLTLRKWEDAHSWSIQTLPGKVRLPTSIFAEVKSHAEAVDIAERNYLPEDMEEDVEGLVRQALRRERPGGNKKRKSEGEGPNGERKRAKLPIRKAATKKDESAPKKKRGRPSLSTTTAAKTPKAKKPPEKGSSEIGSGERRRSGRVAAAPAAYRERDDEEDDEEMGDGVAEWVYEDEDGNVIDVTRDTLDADDADVDEAETGAAGADEAADAHTDDEEGKGGNAEAVEEDMEVEQATNNHSTESSAEPEPEPEPPKSSPRTKSKAPAAKVAAPSPKGKGKAAANSRAKRTTRV